MGDYANYHCFGFNPERRACNDESEVKRVEDDNLKEEFTKRLLETKREGIDFLIIYMDECGFFTAPCSGNYHLAKEGGLLEHSLNVLHNAEKLSATLIGDDITDEFKNSIVICALLHDLGKMGQFEKPNYVDNVLKSGKVSDTKPYTTNPKLLPVDHEIRSIAIASMFIDLTEEEQFAILYHNGLYGQVGKYVLQGKETKLYMIIHWADMWAARVIEKE